MDVKHMKIAGMVFNDPILVQSCSPHKVTVRRIDRIFFLYSRL